MTEAEPRALTSETYAAARHEVHLHDHAVCTYASQDELVLALRTFLDEGLRTQQTCVFVHSFDREDEAWALLEKARKDVRTLRGDQLVLVSLYRDAFEGSARRIDYEHVKSVVTSLTNQAHQTGRTGVRLFVDASRRYFADARTDEWFAFEAWLGRRLQAQVGLVCAYRREDALASHIFPSVLKTHAYRFEGRR